MVRAKKPRHGVDQGWLFAGLRILGRCRNPASAAAVLRPGGLSGISKFTNLRRNLVGLAESRLLIDFARRRQNHFGKKFPQLFSGQRTADDFRRTIPRFQGDAFDRNLQLATHVKTLRRGRIARLHSLRWPGCWLRARTSSRSPAPSASVISKTISVLLTSR